MRWFKHLVASGDDPDIGAIMSKFGFKGYYLFFRTLEIMSDEFNIENPGEKTFNFQWFLGRFPRRIDKKTLINFLDFCQNSLEKPRIIYNLNGKNLHVNFPKLKELTDDYTARVVRSKSEVDTNQLQNKSSQKTIPRSKNKDIRSKNKDINEQEDLDFLFNKWFDRYPRKEDKGKAKEKWLALVVGKKVDPQEIEDALTGYINVLHNQRTDREFVKHAKTFLFNGNEKKKVESTWRPYILYADPKYKKKPEL